MVMLANQPPYMVCIGRTLLNCSRLPFPSPHRGTGRIEHLNLLAVETQLATSQVQPETQQAASLQKNLALAVLEALPGALLAVLLAFLGARVTADQAFALQLLAQLDVKD